MRLENAWIIGRNAAQRGAKLADTFRAAAGRADGLIANLAGNGVSPAMMLPTGCAGCLMLRADEFAVYVAGSDMGRAVTPSTIATGDKMAGSAMGAATCSTLAGTGWAKRLLITTTDMSIVLAGGSSAGGAVRQAFGARQAVTHIARKGMLATERVAVTGTEDRATSPNRLLAFMAGYCVR
jgi:uncharacterized OsmC-like protein